MTNISSESGPETELKQQAPPSSSPGPEELLGFTPASELYSVGIFHGRLFFFFSLLVVEFFRFEYRICICDSSR